MSSKWLNVGKLVNTHGLRGEIKVLSQTDFPDVRFAPGSELAVIDPDGKQVVPVVVESAKEHKGMYILKLKGYDDINRVEKYKGWSIKVAGDDLVELDEGEYYLHEIVGCGVVTDTGEELGTIVEVLRPGANDVWVVERPKGKPVLLPFIKDVVLDINTKDRIVTVHLMEGLI
ncbi:ribosome maturation factor RimM [Paenibacillus tarimensis]